MQAAPLTCVSSLLFCLMHLEPCLLLPRWLDHPVLTGGWSEASEPCGLEVVEGPCPFPGPEASLQRNQIASLGMILLQ